MIAGKPMRAILSLFTVVTLLVEGTTGWCCHPPGHDEMCCSAPVVSPEVDACCRHHAQTTNQSGQKPVGPCQGEPKCQGICIFLPSQKTLVEMPELVSLFDVAGMLPTLSVDHMAATVIGSSSSDPFDAESPLVRLYLLHRTFLI